MQTTWLRLVRGHGSISDSRAVSAWLPPPHAAEAWKVAKAHGKVDTTDVDDLDTLLPEQASAEEHATIGDENRRLWSAVRRLNDRCQRLLRVIAFEDRPDYAHIASDHRDAHRQHRPHTEPVPREAPRPAGRTADSAGGGLA